MTDTPNRSDTTAISPGQLWVPTVPRTRQRPKMVTAVGRDPAFEGGEFVETGSGIRIALPWFRRWVTKYRAEVQEAAP